MSNLELGLPDLADQHSHISRTRAEVKKRRKKRIGKGIVWILTLAIWAGLLYGAYTLAESYYHNIESRLDQLQQTNQQHIDVLNQSIALLQLQLTKNEEDAQALQSQFQEVKSSVEAVKEEVALAGDSLNASDDTKAALSERISALSAELQKLQTSIKKLEEAARVY